MGFREFYIEAEAPAMSASKDGVYKIKKAALGGYNKKDDDDNDNDGDGGDSGGGE
jgi:hypothetical protein